MANKDIKALDVKLHNFIVEQNEFNRHAYNRINKLRECVLVLSEIEMRQQGHFSVCMSAIK